jgi:hypothetical protein
MVSFNCAANPCALVATTLIEIRAASFALKDKMGVAVLSVARREMGAALAAWNRALTRLRGLVKRRIGAEMNRSGTTDCEIVWANNARVVTLLTSVVSTTTRD